MKYKPRIIFFLLLGGITVLYSCSEKRDPRLDSFETPIWTDADFVLADGSIIRQEVVAYKRPPFCKGDGDFTYIAGKRPTGMSGFMGGGANMITFYHDFVNYRNEFTYSHNQIGFILGFPGGARSIDPSGRLLAEAKLLRFLKGGSGNRGMKGLEIQEFHYNSEGKLIFTCKSEISFNLQVKVSEYDTIGKKQRDYYCLWPTIGI